MKFAVGAALSSPLREERGWGEAMQTGKGLDRFCRTIAISIFDFLISDFPAIHVQTNALYLQKIIL